MDELTGDVARSLTSLVASELSDQVENERGKQTYTSMTQEALRQDRQQRRALQISTVRHTSTKLPLETSYIFTFASTPPTQR